MKNAVVILYAVLIFTAPAVLAQDEQPGVDEKNPPPEELLFRNVSVVSAAKKVQQRSEAPAAISVITRQDIESSGARTIAEAIQFIAGVNVFGLQGANIRGVGSGSRILLLVDGRRCNDVFSGGFEDGLERPLTKVERIEVIKGPASALYGTNAFAGIINVITRRPLTARGLEVHARAGNFSTRAVETTWGNDGGNVDTLFSLSGYSDRGHDLRGTNDDVRALEFFGKAEGYGFTVSGGLRPSKRGVPNIGGNLTPTSSSRRTDSFGHVQYARELRPEWSVYSQLYFQREHLDLRDPSGDLDIRDLRIEAEARTHYRLSERNEFTAGIELRRDRTTDDSTAVQGRFRSTNKSIFVEDELRVTNRVRLTAGVRADDNSVFGSSVNPRVGVVASLPTGTIVKGFYGRAFRGPDFVLLFTDIQLGVFRLVRNPNLKPERVTSMEVEVTHPVSPWLDASLNVYRNSLRDLIAVVFTSGTNLTYVNRGEASANGVEVGVHGQLGNELSFFSNFAYQDAEDDTTGASIALVPSRTVNAGLTYRPGETLTVGVFGKYVGPRPTTDLAGRPTSLPHYYKVDVSLTARLRENLDLTAAIYNIFDAVYERSLGSPQYRTQALIGLRYRAW